MKTSNSFLKINYDNQEFLIEVIYTNNKNIYMLFKENRFILKTNTPDLSKAEIQNFIYKSIKNLLLKKHDKPSLEINKAQCEFWMLGNLYSYQFINYSIVITNKFNNSIEIIKCPNEKRIIDNLWNYIKHKLSEKIDLCIKNYFLLKPQFKIPNLKYKILNKKTAWGTAYPSKSLITFSKYLGLFSFEYIQYVVFHELTHFIHPNHSSKFWYDLKELIKNCKIIRKKLNNHEFNINGPTNERRIS
ncbi:Protein of uncharacterised function DUF45 [Metamycoplasma cloacale]|uniref:DUF45 domain-containing protein n=1 Tax=Metamycoplasma cloacale TaxID=92401 RepID=A0A2Z4LN94_9BACT|nr:YgjP-like metallopeptidase domain-containing protein [Metamycoplasma cloacale]AWX42727.1 DUF45 domain-containing protein [Metamycoplasma cloacale]VEU79461.1 Protein of uncharacterised function DUF45 [Metamycoplasma cloacale]